MLSFSSLLALGLLSLSTVPVVRASVTCIDGKEVLTDIGNLALDVVITGDLGGPPDVVTYSPVPLGGQQSVVWTAVGASIVDGTSIGGAAGMLYINSGGDIQVQFAKVSSPNVELDIIDGAEISFAASDPNNPVFNEINDGIFGTSPTLTTIPGSGSCYDSNFNTIFPGSSGCKAPTLTLNADGSLSLNVFDGSVSSYGSLTWNWYSDYQQDCNTGHSGGDPQFDGFLGQSFQVHGVSGSIYNVISTPSLQLNALFTYLSSGRCRSGTMCFGHPGNYFGEVGLSLKSELGKVDRIHVVAGPVDIGLQVFVNDSPLKVSTSSIGLGSSSVVWTDPFEVTVNTAEFSLRLVNSDMFLNEDVSINEALLVRIRDYKRAVKSGNSTDDLPHGLLGQTWQKKIFANRWKYIEGALYDYTVADGIMGTQFKYNRF